MKKWYNVEISYATREDIKRVNKFKNWLHENKIKFEISLVDNLVHFEILLNKETVVKVNNALDEIVWFDAIWEQ